MDVRMSSKGILRQRVRDFLHERKKKRTIPYLFEKDKNKGRVSRQHRNKCM